MMTTSLYNGSGRDPRPVGQQVVRATYADGRTCIEVQDDGPGISAANAARVFEPFFTTARAQGGTGLGLPIVRAIARGAGGDVALVAHERGAGFRVELPG